MHLTHVITVWEEIEPEAYALKIWPCRSNSKKEDIKYGHFLTQRRTKKLQWMRHMAFRVSRIPLFSRQGQTLITSFSWSEENCLLLLCVNNISISRRKRSNLQVDQDYNEYVQGWIMSQLTLVFARSGDVVVFACCSKSNWNLCSEIFLSFGLGSHKSNTNSKLSFIFFLSLSPFTIYCKKRVSN